MPLLVNLHHLARHELVLQGELPVAELDIETFDEVIRLEQPLRYELEVEQLDQQLLVRGTLELILQCECVRCLKPVAYPLRLEDWICHVPLQGEEAAAVESDCVDLTPYVREDILLAFPQHPLCQPECPGLSPADRGRASTQSGAEGTECSSVWSELDKLRL
jgi:uncharacterized protein